MRTTVAVLVVTVALAHASVVRAQAPARVGFVDTRGVLAAIPQGQRIKAEVDQLRAAGQARQDAAFRRLAEQQRLGGSLGSLQRRIQDFRDVQSRRGQEVRDLEDRLTSESLRAMREAIAVIAAGRGFTVVVDRPSVFRGDQALDLTAEVIERLGGRAATRPRPTPPAGPMATVDLMRVRAGCRAGRAVEAEIQRLERTPHDARNQAMADYERMQAELARDRSKLSVMDVMRRQRELRAAMMAVHQGMRDAGRRLPRRRRELIAALHHDAVQAVAQVASRAGYVLVVGSTERLRGGQAPPDVTAAVIRELDGEDPRPPVIAPLMPAQIAVVDLRALAAPAEPAQAAAHAARLKAAMQAEAARYRLVVAEPLFRAAQVADVTPQVARRMGVVLSAAPASAPASAPRRRSAP
ncbi:MAG TPA: OmpH family outer membrane protein [Polyangia bacterium]|jgi:Skp family chaperone for outer membrane proteins